MIDNPVTTIKNSWKTNNLGAGMFIIGTILCVFGVILSIVWRLNFISISDNVAYVVTMIGLGVPFILAGIGIILRPKKLPMSMISEEINKNYIEVIDQNYIEGTNENYIGNSEMLIMELVVSFLLVMLLFASYPNGWDYPTFYILTVPYAICLFLLTIGILSNMNNKETEILCMKKEAEHSDIIIEEKEEMCKDNSAPDYTMDFARKLNGNIDELKTIMDELKISIDIGTNDIAERTAMVANKYKLDNERLHNDLHGFKQRTEKEKIELKERANERVIKSLMNTLNSIDELSKYRDKNANYTVGDIGGIKDNIYNIIKNEGVDIINPSIGDNFDDKKCCAIKTIETDKFPDNRIMDIKKIGCMFKSGKVINYADVIVSKNSIKVEATKIDTNVDVKVGTKTQAEATKVDTKTDVKTDTKVQTEATKVDVKAQTEVAKMDTKAKIEVDKVDTKTDTKTGIQALIEYVKTKIFGKADNNEQNKKDENNEVCITPEFKKKGD